VASVIVTRNITEPSLEVVRPGWLVIIDNLHPKGFGANHNAAFQHAHTPYFAVLNPDIRLVGNPFPALLECMENDTVARCAPAVVNPAGGMEDSARQFPSLVDLVLKALHRYEGRLHYELGDPPLPAPWVAGMFMLLRSSNYTALGGFDEGFFLYYEDVDLCARSWNAGQNVMLCPSVHVVHDARRASRHNPKHMAWHAASMARYFRKHFRRPYQRPVG
jgi:GT2 family glycosyltransferase